MKVAITIEQILQYLLNLSLMLSLGSNIKLDATTCQKQVL